MHCTGIVPEWQILDERELLGYSSRTPLPADNRLFRCSASHLFRQCRRVLVVPATAPVCSVSLRFNDRNLRVAISLKRTHSMKGTPDGAA